MFKLTRYNFIKLLVLATICITIYQFKYGIYSLKATQARFDLKNQQSVDTSIQNEFQNIYKHFIWGPDGGGSGSGSSVNYTTITRSIISSVIQKYKIKSMLDAPCGAMVCIIDIN